MVIHEDLFWDDEAMLVDILESHWSLGPDERPAIVYDLESLMTDGREGIVYVYQMGRHDSDSSIDYETISRESSLGIKVACRFRHDFIRYANEVRRILSAIRRGGPDTLGNHYLWCEVTGDRWSKDGNGWYTVFFDVIFRVYNTPFRSAGFNDKLNNSLK